MRSIFIKLCIFIFAVEAGKNIAAHHRTGSGKYVADDKAKVSVRSWLPKPVRFLLILTGSFMIDKYLFISENRRSDWKMQENTTRRRMFKKCF